jgi:hypothetical protein
MLLGGYGSAHPTEPVPPTVRLLIPAYFYPAGQGLQDWNRVIQAAAKVPITAIVNPGSGPGEKVDPNYRQIFQLAKDTRITLIGYVTLSYAKRPIASVKGDIDRWLVFYPDLQGIFFDEQPSGVEHAPFAEECFAYARQKIPKAQVVSNPGTACAREYFTGPSAPTVCLFENQRGFEDYRLPSWADPLPPFRFAILHYNLKTVDEMRQVLQAAIQQRAGFIFLTDRQAPTPWTGLPSFWNEELDAVIKINQTIDVPLRTN